MARRRTSRSSTPSVEGFRQSTPSREDVARRAYELFEARGAQPGWDLDDWLQAERELSSIRPEDASEEQAIAGSQRDFSRRRVVNDSTMET
jgi:hypothetical protein